jgi:azurin
MSLLLIVFPFIASCKQFHILCNNEINGNMHLSDAEAGEIPISKKCKQFHLTSYNEVENLRVFGHNNVFIPLLVVAYK